MKWTNKTLAAAVAAACAGTALAGCSKDGGTVAPSDSAAPAVSASEKPVELHIVSRQLGEAEDINRVKSELEKKLNVKLNWEVKPAANYPQTTQVVLSSGDYPDLMEMWWSNPQKEITQFAEDGVLQPLNELLDKYGSNIRKWRPEKETWLYPFKDDRVYTIPSRFNEAGVEGIYTLRQDWLDKLKLSKPTNLDELYQVLKAFTFDDPDGNGKKDTYGVGHGVNGQKSLFNGAPFEFILNAHGAVPGWNVVDGKLVSGTVMPQMKEAIKYYRKLYQEGIVEPEFPILTREKYMERKNLNQYGFEYWWATNLDPNVSAWWRDFKKAVPGAEIAFLTPFPVDGKVTFPRTAVRSYSPSLALFTKDPAKQKKAIELVDYLASDEGAELAAFGIKGEHWDETDGRIVARALPAEESRKVGNVYSWIFRQKIYPRSITELEKQAVDAYKSITVKPVEIDTTPTQLQSGKALDDLRTNRLMKMVVDKNVDVDAEFDKFVKEWLDAGGQKLTEEANQAYQGGK